MTHMATPTTSSPSEREFHMPSKSTGQGRRECDGWGPALVAALEGARDILLAPLNEQRGGA
jgi:hypothetical protein